MPLGHKGGYHPLGSNVLTTGNLYNLQSLPRRLERGCQTWMHGTQSDDFFEKKDCIEVLIACVWKKKQRWGWLISLLSLFTIS